MKKSTGFSLIELMVVIAIIGVLAVIGLPSYNTWVQNSRVRNGAESILNGLQLARSEAVARNTRIAFVFTDAASGWTLGCFAVSVTCPAVIQSRAASDGSGGTSVVVNNAAVANTVYFSNLGTLVDAAGAAVAGVMTIDVDSTVLSGSESRELRIQISTSGSVRMCDPNVGSDDPRKC